MIDRDTIYKMPKIDIHRHLDGDVKPKVLFELAEKDSVKIPANSSDELELYFKDLREQGIVSLLQNGFGLVTSLMQSKENLQTVAYEGVRNLADDNIVYGEFRFAPQYHTGESEYYKHSKDNAEKLSYEEIIKAVSSGLSKGEKEFGVKTNLIVCIGREIDSETGVKIADAALNCLNYNVVGLDLACDEASFPPERHVDAYRKTFNTKLKRTVHSGEFGDQPYENIKKSIDDLDANRLGHATPLSKYDDLIEVVVDRKIGIEMCLESNMFCGFIKSRKELGIQQLLSKNVLLSINSDDPAMFGYTLTDTLHRLEEECSLGMKKLKTLETNAIETAFLSKNERADLFNIIEDTYKV